MQPCQLYFNRDPPQQQLFTAAAALFALTGDSEFRHDADTFWLAPDSPDTDFNLLISNWNNVWLQGVSLLAMTSQSDPPGALRPQEEYRALMRMAALRWAACSSGEAATGFCK